MDLIPFVLPDAQLVDPGPSVLPDAQNMDSASSVSDYPTPQFLVHSRQETRKILRPFSVHWQRNFQIIFLLINLFTINRTVPRRITRASHGIVKPNLRYTLVVAAEVAYVPRPYKLTISIPE